MAEKKKDRCADCHFWSPIDERKFLGICGHRDRSFDMTDKHESCKDFEAKEPV